MNYLMMIGLLLLLPEALSAQCSDLRRASGSLQWSENAKIVAPDRSWVVETHPIICTEENCTPVVLRKCGKSKSWPLFILRRRADLYWNVDSKHLLVVNQPLSGTSKLLLFSVPALDAKIYEPKPDRLDMTVVEMLAQLLGSQRHLQFYLPTFVSWKGNDLLLAVGGETYTEKIGPFRTYCYGFRIDSDTLEVKKVLAKNELLESTGRSCQVSP